MDAYESKAKVELLSDMKVAYNSHLHKLYIVALADQVTYMHILYNANEQVPISIVVHGTNYAYIW